MPKPKQIDQAAREWKYQRVIELSKLGVAPKYIAQRTGLGLHLVYQIRMARREELHT